MRLLLLIASLSLIFFVSCELGNEASESYFDATDSHYEGRNCMECHVSGESGRGWFTVAGTVYDSGLTNPYVNPTVIFSTLPDAGGREVLRVEGDARGNFFTTRSIDFKEVLYVSIVGKSGNVKYKPSPVTDGACNSCHGNTAPKLWLDEN